MQIPSPPLLPGTVPPPLDLFGFLGLFVVALELILSALPRKFRNRILETLFPGLRRARLRESNGLDHRGPPRSAETARRFQSRPGSCASIAGKRLRRTIPGLSIRTESLCIATVFFGPRQARPKVIPRHG